MFNRSFFAAFAAMTLAVSPAYAQEASQGLVFEPYVGTFWDAYDISPDGSRLGAIGGIKVSHPVGSRVRALVNLGYAESSNVSNPAGLANYWIYDNVWLLSAVGAEYDFMTGPTTASIGLQAGAGWRDNELSGSVGQPSPEADFYSRGGFDPFDVFIPGVTVRQNLIGRAGIAVSFQDHIFDLLEGSPNHSPSFSIGLSLR